MALHLRHQRLPQHLRGQAAGLGTATGADLMAYGIDVVTSTISATHILRLVAKP